MEERIFRSSSNRELRRTTNAVEGSGIEPTTSRTRSGNLTAGQKWDVFARSAEFALLTPGPSAMSTAMRSRPVQGVNDHHLVEVKRIGRCRDPEQPQGAWAARERCCGNDYPHRSQLGDGAVDHAL